MKVLIRDDKSNWWYVRLDDGKEGWAPGPYLTVFIHTFI